MFTQKLLDWTECEIEETLGVNEYDTEENTIYLNKLDDEMVGHAIKFIMGRPATKNWSLHHELGHAVFYHLDLEEDEEAVKIFGDFSKDYKGVTALFLSTLKSEDEDYATPYAQTHPEEDFADSFALFLEQGKIPKGISKTLRKKLNYCKKIINSIV